MIRFELTPSDILGRFRKNLDLAGITGAHHENLIAFARFTLPPSYWDTTRALSICTRLAPQCFGFEPTALLELKTFWEKEVLR